ncbi:hypothetical protein MMC16_004594 [Acarospora aff. strigata]|nr:hypothetical protein [Acarospora aff. strigata]
MSHPLQVSATAGRVEFSRSINTSALKDKSVLVTGGASGLGAGFARAFAEAGAYVTIADIQAEQGQKHAEELNANGYHVKFVQTDVTSWASQVSAFKAAINQCPSKSIDIVVTAAGLQGHGFVDPDDEPPSLDKDPPEPSTKTIDINLTGVFYSTKLALHYFQLNSAPDSSNKQDRKSIILISSLAAYIELPWLGDYQASKYGVRGLFKALRNNVGAMGVRMNLIAPWFVQTAMTKDIGPKLEERGLVLAKKETVVEAVMRCATDEGISGRAIAVAASGNIDLRDDAEGLDAGVEIDRYVGGEIKGYLPLTLDAMSSIKF